MPSTEVVFIVHFISSMFMCGICWFVQIVHYPLFLAVPLKDFPAYERKNFVTAYLTVPVMVVEMITGVYLLAQFPEALHFLNVGLLGIIALSTVVYQVPMHLSLSQTASTATIKRLVKTNWIRTISWTSRTVILGTMLAQML